MTQPTRTVRGTYLLLAQLNHAVAIRVGKLGTFDFAIGWYAYAGSALGPGGLRARLARHARADKRLHWHVDYLLQHAVLQAAWQAACPQRLECDWAAAMLDLPGAQAPVPGFGASDCRCTTHLIYLPRRPGDRQIAAALSARTPPPANVRRTPPTPSP
jgi:Uri superfamily endonuclease